MVHHVSDQELSTLFRKHLSHVAVPAEVHARVQRQVLCEAIFTLQTDRLNPVAAKTHAWHATFPSLLHAPRLAMAGVGAAIVVLTLLYVHQILRTIPSTAHVTMREEGTGFIVSERQRTIDPVVTDKFTKVTEGDSIFVHSGTVQIEYIEGWRTTLAAGANIEVQEFEKSPDANRLVLVVHQGEVLTEILKPLQHGDSLEIRSSSATAYARGTSFIVRAESDTSTYFAVLSGQIEVELAGEKVTVASGEELQATQGMALAVQQRQPNSENLTAVANEPSATNASEERALSDAASQNHITTVATASTAAADAEPRVNALAVTANGDWYLVCCSTEKQLSWMAAGELGMAQGSNLPILPNESASASALRQPGTAEVSARTPGLTQTSTPTPTPSATATVGSISVPFPTDRATSTRRATPTEPAESVSPTPSSTPLATRQEATPQGTTPSEAATGAPPTDSTDSTTATTPTPLVPTSTPTETEEAVTSDNDDNGDRGEDSDSDSDSGSDDGGDHHAPFTPTATPVTTSPAAEKPTATATQQPLSTTPPDATTIASTMVPNYTSMPIHLVTPTPVSQPTGSTVRPSPTPSPLLPTLVVPETRIATPTENLGTYTPTATSISASATANAPTPQLVTPTFTPVRRPTTDKLTPLPEPTESAGATPDPVASPTHAEPTPTPTSPQLITPTPTANRGPGILRRVRNGQPSRDE